MPKTRKGFKIVRRSRFTCYSVLPLGLETEYSTDYWTERTDAHGPFAVFKKIKQAYEFLRNIHSPQGAIFACKYKKSKENGLWYISNDLRFNLLKKGLPKGTVCADKVKLTQIHFVN